MQVLKVSVIGIIGCGSGKELLERPFNEVVNSGHPNFPFCLGWANHTWSTKTWSASNSEFKRNCNNGTRHIQEKKIMNCILIHI